MISNVKNKEVFDKTSILLKYPIKAINPKRCCIKWG